MNDVKKENFTLCLRISSEGTCPVWGHHRETLLWSLDDLVVYALDIARTDADWLPWKIYLTGAGIIWQAEPEWDRGSIIKDLEQYINTI